MADEKELLLEMERRGLEQTIINQQKEMDILTDTINVSIEKIDAFSSQIKDANTILFNIDTKNTSLEKEQSDQIVIYKENYMAKEVIEDNFKEVIK